MAKEVQLERIKVTATDGNFSFLLPDGCNVVLAHNIISRCSILREVISTAETGAEHAIYLPKGILACWAQCLEALQGFRAQASKSINLVASNTQLVQFLQVWPYASCTAASSVALNI